MTTAYALIILVVIVASCIPLVSGITDLLRDKRPLLGIAMIFVGLHYLVLMGLFYLGDHVGIADCLTMLGATR